MHKTYVLAAADAALAVEEANAANNGPSKT